jgi:hypothetical protein
MVVVVMMMMMMMMSTFRKYNPLSNMRQPIGLLGIHRKSIFGTGGLKSNHFATRIMPRPTSHLHVAR